MFARMRRWRDGRLLHVGCRRHTRLSETHVVLKQLTSAYLAVAHESSDHIENYFSREEVQALEKMAAIAEQMRDRNDLFEVASVHWQTFWEATNARLVADVKAVLSEFDSLALPDQQQSDNLEEALKFYEASRRVIHEFLQEYEQQEGDRTNSVMAAFAAQRDFADRQEKLAPLTKYLDLQRGDKQQPDWK